MDRTLQEKTRQEFKTHLKEFAKSLQPQVTTEDGHWTIKGFLDVFRNVYTITPDTKIVSKVLEIHLFPRLLEFANRIGYRIVLTKSQNHYPDFSFVQKSDKSIRFAVDLKTTYRVDEVNVNGYTLGSHGKYFIDPTSDKNVRFPYGSYWGHFCLGLIYSRIALVEEPSDSKSAGGEKNAVAAKEESDDDENDLEEMKVYAVKDLGSQETAAPTVRRREVDSLQEIASVIKDLHFFACEKWEIASDQEGSHNTANIGGIKNIENILNGRGVFSNLGEAWFNEYWTNYGKIVDPNTGENITSLYDYLAFKGEDPTKAFYEKNRQVGSNRKKKRKTAL